MKISGIGANDSLSVLFLSVILGPADGVLAQDLGAAVAQGVLAKAAVVGVAARGRAAPSLVPGDAGPAQTRYSSGVLWININIA